MAEVKIILADGEVKVGDICFCIEQYKSGVIEIGPVEHVYVDGPSEQWFLCAANQFYEPRRCFKTREAAVAQLLSELEFDRKSLQMQLRRVEERIAEQTKKEK